MNNWKINIHSLTYLWFSGYWQQNRSIRLAKRSDKLCECKKKIKNKKCLILTSNASFQAERNTFGDKGFQEGFSNTVSLDIQKWKIKILKCFLFCRLLTTLHKERDGKKDLSIMWVQKTLKKSFLILTDAVTFQALRNYVGEKGWQEGFYNTVSIDIGK